MSSQSDLDQPGPPKITVDDLQLAGKRRRQRRASSGLTFFLKKSTLESNRRKIQTEHIDFVSYWFHLSQFYFL